MEKAKILVISATGNVGTELVKQLPRDGRDWVARHRYAFEQREVK